MSDEETRELTPDVEADGGADVDAAEAGAGVIEADVHADAADTAADADEDGQDVAAEDAGPFRVEPIRQWVSLPHGSCNVRVGHGSLDLLGAVTKGASSTRRSCLLAVQEGCPDDVAERIRRQLTDAGYDVSRATLPIEGACRTQEAAAELFCRLAACAITGDDLLCAVGHLDALSLAAHVGAHWCGGLDLACVALDLASSVIAPITPRALDVAGHGERITVAGYAKSFFVDLDLFDLGSDARTDAGGALPAPEPVLLARAMMVHSALVDSEKAFSTLWDRSADIAAGDVVALADQLVDTLKSRGRTVASTSVSIRQSITHGETFARALAGLAPDVPASTRVAEAMRFSARLSAGKEMLSVDDVLAIDELLARLGVGVASCDVDPDALFEAIRAERFARSRRFLLGLPRALGRVRLTTVEDELLREHTAAWCAVHRG